MKKCPRCDTQKEEQDIRWMWDFQKDGKQYYCECVCSECSTELSK